MKRNRWSHGWREWKKSSLQIYVWSATGREMCSCRTKKVIAHGMDGIFPADTWNRANLSHRPSFVRSGRKRAYDRKPEALRDQGVPQGAGRETVYRLSVCSKPIFRGAALVGRGRRFLVSAFRTETIEGAGRWIFGDAACFHV